MWVVTLHQDQCDPALLDDVTSTPYRRLAGDDAIMLDRLMAHVSQDSDKLSLFNAGLHYVVRSAHHLTVVEGTSPRKPLHPAVLQAFRTMRTVVDLPSAKALAKACGVSADYLGQLLMEQTGRGFVEWRNRIRLERFQTIYPASRNLLTAALDAGFGSYQPFHRIFVELMGMTPGKWAREGGEPLTALDGWAPENKGVSDRMVWYPLSGVALPGTQGWLTPDFVRSLLSGNAHQGEHPPIESFVHSADELRQHGECLISALELRDPDNAGRLRRVNAQADLFGQRVYQSIDAFDVGDLATITGAYVIVAWMAVNRAPMINLEAGPLLVARARAALSASATFETVSPARRRQVATAFFAQIIIAREALNGVWSGAEEATRDRILDGIGDIGQLITGINLRTLRLDY